MPYWVFAEPLSTLPVLPLLQGGGPGSLHSWASSSSGFQQGWANADLWQESEAWMRVKPGCFPQTLLPCMGHPLEWLSSPNKGNSFCGAALFYSYSCSSLQVLGPVSFQT